MRAFPHVFTVGHSTRGASDFVTLLREGGIQLVVDVRRHPGSRRHPHFNREALERRLRGEGIGYRHEEVLGGRRAAGGGDRNAGLRSAGFRGYADHMATTEFQSALQRLLEDGRRLRVAVMCAESVPWRCHRWLLADALTARDARVVHLLGPGRQRAHTLSPGARVAADGTVSWPPTPAEQTSLLEEPEPQPRRSIGT